MYDPEIRYFQQTCFQNRVDLRDSRDHNALKLSEKTEAFEKIRAEKSAFYRTVLSFKKPKELWKVMNTVLHPPTNEQL